MLISLNSEAFLEGVAKEVKVLPLPWGRFWASLSMTPPGGNMKLRPLLIILVLTKVKSRPHNLFLSPYSSFLKALECYLNFKALAMFSISDRNIKSTLAVFPLKPIPNSVLLGICCCSNSHPKWPFFSLHYKQCCDEHWGARVSFRSGFLGVYAQEWDCWVIWQFYFQFFKESPHCSSP